ncbi:hypothetical protein C2S51_028361 [Perilla frutescens var. frutescens]|nr:hypothetical protein C2S51_028361 [Perilla frutescens var. frutescens]
MDLWVVAAAAGAGYIAKNLQNFSDDKKESPSLKYSYNVQPESRNFLQQLREKTCPLRRLARKRVEDDYFPDLDNNSDAKFSEIDRSSSRDREASAVSINSDYSEKAGILEDFSKGWISGLTAEGVGENQQVGDNRNLSRINGGKMARNRRYRVHSTNMEQNSSCLYPPSSMSAVRPVLVTDVMWGENSSFSQLDGCSEDHKTSSSSSLKQFESSNLQQSGSRESRSQGAETMLLFITGMTVGIFTATTSWKNEVDKLNRQLMQMQNLVQDLHEELDMKEMMMVKELDMEGVLPPGEEDTPLSTEEPVSSPSLVKAGKLSKTDGVKANDKKAENLELLSRIEAELQAELEMLEQNMKESELKRISNVVELDPDFEPEIVRGDLKPAMVEHESESGRSTTGTRTDGSKPANYAVSPWELSLRLHELIESRLETRIKELEIALSHSDNRVEDYGRRFSCSETESSSTHHSPTCICDEHDKGEDEPSNDGESGSHVIDQGTRSSSRIQNGDYYDSISHHGGEDRSPNEDSMSEDEGSDESEMLLIKQIIERRRSGSSFNFKMD